MNREKKTHWLLTTILVLAVCGVAGLALSALLFFRDPGPTYASATLEFTFDGAAEGVAPNGVRFDLRDMLRDEVLSEALRTAALDDRYTPEQLRSSIVVTGVYPENLAEKVTYYESLLDFTVNRELTLGDYHPTTFRVELHNDFDSSLSRDRLTALLDGITEAYRAYFGRVYAYGKSMELSAFELEDYDYPQQIQILSGYYAAISGYAKELYETAPAFRFGGIGFSDVGVRLDTLIENDITRLNADMIINALTRDTDRLMIQYQYQIQDLSTQREKRSQELAKLDRLIASYEKNEIIYLSTAESLMKIDGNSSETYDDLVSRRKTVADSVTAISGSISDYELMIEDLLVSTGASRGEEAEAALSEEGEETPAVRTAGLSAAELAAAERRLSSQRAMLEENIRSLIADGDAVISDFRKMLDNYNSLLINEQTVTVTNRDYEAPGLLSGSFIMLAVRTAGPIVALGFMVCMALIAISRKKEE